MKRSPQQTVIGFLVELVWALRVQRFMLAGDLRRIRAQLAERLDTLLDTHVFPAVLAYTTHRAHITLMALLWLALLIGGSWTAFELVGGNYTNGLSGLMTCIIALQQAHHRRENHEQHAATHARLDAHEERLTALHAHVTRRRNGGTGKADPADQASPSNAD